ncbi:MAG: hypothetical protein LBJ02_00805 [Bifidobacteriaceae bacterium]|jgi:hypothetical protein|nr:hypothetical protein [Bifidobacteriaceae bacterium]
MKRWWVLTAAVAVALAGLAGCSAKDGVASIDGSSPAPSGPRQAERAENFAACLTKAGLAAQALDLGDGQKQLQIDVDDPYLLGLADGSSWSFPGTANQTDAAGRAAIAGMEELAAPYLTDDAARAARSEDGSVPYLIVGALDRTEDLAKCLEQTGYESPQLDHSPERELEMKREVVDATIGWVECARQNGFPDMADPAAPRADNFQTLPTAVLPADVTEAEVRALAASCPTLDIAAAKARDDALAALPENASEADYAAVDRDHPDQSTPNVGFDVPGMNGDHSGRVEVAPETLAHYESLWAILNEASDAYFEGKNNER